MGAKRPYALAGGILLGPMRVALLLLWTLLLPLTGSRWAIAPSAEDDCCAQSACCCDQVLEPTESCCGEDAASRAPVLVAVCGCGDHDLTWIVVPSVRFPLPPAVPRPAVGSGQHAVPAEPCARRTEVRQGPEPPPPRAV